MSSQVYHLRFLHLIFNDARLDTAEDIVTKQ